MGASEALAPPPALRARVLAAADQLPQLPPKVRPDRRRRRSRRWTARDRRAAAAAVLVVARRASAVSQLRGRRPAALMAATVSQVFTGRRTPTPRPSTTDHGGG